MITLHDFLKYSFVKSALHPISTTLVGEGFTFCTTVVDTLIAKARPPKQPGVYVIYGIETTHLYVGSSVNLHKRCLDHQARLRRRGSKHSKLQEFYNNTANDRIGFRYAVLPDHSAALQVEQRALDLVCTHPKLLNTALDVYGSMSGVKMSDSAKLKMSIAKKGKPLKPEHIAKLKLLRSNSEYRSRLSKALTGRHITPEHRVKIRDSMVKTWSNPTYKEKLSNTHRENYKDPEHRNRMNECVAASQRRPEVRAKHSANNTGAGNPKAKPVKVLDVIYPYAEAAAKVLGISRQTLYKRLKDPLNIDYVYLTE